MPAADSSSYPRDTTPFGGAVGSTGFFFSRRRYLFIVLFFLGLAKLLLYGAIQFTEQSHLLTVLQEARRCGRLAWKSREGFFEFQL